MPFAHPFWLYLLYCVPFFWFCFSGQSPWANPITLSKKSFSLSYYVLLSLSFAWIFLWCCSLHCVLLLFLCRISVCLFTLFGSSYFIFYLCRIILGPAYWFARPMALPGSFSTFLSTQNHQFNNKYVANAARCASYPNWWRE